MSHKGGNISRCQDNSRLEFEAKISSLSLPPDDHCPLLFLNIDDFLEIFTLERKRPPEVQ